MKLIFIFTLLLSSIVRADNDIDLKIDWVQNVAKSTILEVCGKAVSKSGKWPLLVSISHGESTFSTLTSKDNKFCQLIARQTWDGKVTVQAGTIDNQSSTTITSDIK